MQKNLLLGLLLALTAGAAAQNTTRVAFTGGLHNATVEPFWNPHPLAQSDLTTPRTGAHFGFIGSIPFSPKSIFRLQPGFMFSAKGATQIQELDTTQTRIMRLTDKQFINYVDIPLNLVMAIPLGGKTKFILGGGPQASLFYNGETSQTSFDTSRKLGFTEVLDLPVGKADGQYRLVHFGINALAGFEFGRVFFTANYSRSLTPYLNQSEKKFTHGTMGASIGIFLGRQPGPKKPGKTNEPKDQDKDGVPDATDACPEQAGTALAQGCPDIDSDGVADKYDGCPTLAGPVDNQGCPPPDRDGDKVPDKEDKCPEVAGIKQYGGCPVPDTDKDGINDEADQCPQVAGTAEHKGCPAPVTIPEVKKEVAEKVAIAARNIVFAFASAELLQPSLPVLNEVADLMQQHPELKLTVEGHTSADGSAAVNQKLSEQRANKVKAYLEFKGVAASRITAAGFGSSRPVRTGTSEQEQSKNRRVELKLE